MVPEKKDTLCSSQKAYTCECCAWERWQECNSVPLQIPFCIYFLSSNKSRLYKGGREKSAELEWGQQGTALEADCRLPSALTCRAETRQHSSSFFILSFRVREGQWWNGWFNKLLCVPEPCARRRGERGREGKRERNRIRIFLTGKGERSHLPIQLPSCKFLKTKCPHSLGNYIKISFIICISDTQDPSWMGGRYKTCRQAFLHE